MNIGDSLINTAENLDRSMFDFVSTRISIGRIFYSLLKRYESKDEIYKIAYSACKNGSALSTIVHEIESLTSRFRRNKPYFQSDEKELSDEQCHQLQALGLEKISQGLKQNKLLDTPELLSIMYRWKHWSGSTKEIADWIFSFIDDKDQRVKFFTNIKSNVKSQSDGAMKIKYYIQYSTVADFVEPESLKEQIQQVINEGLLKEDLDTLNAVNVLLEEIEKPELRQRQHWFDD